MRPGDKITTSDGRELTAVVTKSNWCDGCEIKFLDADCGTYKCVSVDSENLVFKTVAP